MFPILAMGVLTRKRDFMNKTLHPYNYPRPWGRLTGSCIAQVGISGRWKVIPSVPSPWLASAPLTQILCGPTSEGVIKHCTPDHRVLRSLRYRRHFIPRANSKSSPQLEPGMRERKRVCLASISLIKFFLLFRQSSYGYSGSSIRQFCLMFAMIFRHNIWILHIALEKLSFLLRVKLSA